MLRLSTGDELWKHELDGEIEMMPVRFDTSDEVAFTLDNYRAPLLLDGRLFLFYEGSTSYDAETGKEKERDKFKINEEGLALTDADPIFDDSRIYMSGRGRVRAIDRRTGNEIWKANDLGTAAEMALVGNVLYVRTGGQFTRIKDGEIVSKGPYGVSAIDANSGDTLWRYKGADKGLTNFAFVDANTIVFADNDDIVYLDARTGKRAAKFGHKIDKPQFLLLNEAGNPVVGGQDEIAAFDRSERELYRVRHKPPGRGVAAIVGAIALRATALYFRYGGVATSAFGIARGGLSVASAANSFRWSGLRSHFGSFDLTTLASNSARNYVTRQIYSYGSLARTPGSISRTSGIEIIRPSGMRNEITPTRGDVQESVYDRLDPTRQMDRLSDYLLRRRRIAELRGNYMYFFTDLPVYTKLRSGPAIHNGRKREPSLFVRRQQTSGFRGAAKIKSYFAGFGP
jgi:hypothetical protein